VRCGVFFDERGNPEAHSLLQGLRENVENLRKNPSISYLFIVVVIKYSLLKMATKKGHAGSGSEQQFNQKNI